MKKQKPPVDADPHASREAERYENPIPSREYLLQMLEQQSGPVAWEQIADALEIDDEGRREAVRRRLIAMSRDGQIASNRVGDFGLIDRMGLIRARVVGHRDGFGFAATSDDSEDLYLHHRQMRKVFDGDEVLVREMPGGYRGKREGAIVRVVRHNTSQLAGRLIKEHGIYYVRPDNPRLTHNVLVEPEHLGGAEKGVYVVVEITQQPSRDGFPVGQIIEVLGEHLSPGMEIDVAMRNYGIPHDWPSDVTAEAADIPDEVQETDKQQRIDLRALPLVTIDGEDARDFDDAVYCEQLDDGWKLIVAIADVSHYVQIGNPLDREAEERGTSVYFPDFVVPMLPEKLSNGLCSLNPEVDRLCMAVEIRIDARGHLTGYQFFEGVMRSHARLTYTTVGQLIEERGDRNSGVRKAHHKLLGPLDCLHDLYKVLRDAREHRGAMDFETTETRILFDEQRKIDKIVPVARNDAHKLIEECMLAANVCAANLLLASELPALYRVHDAPKQEKIANLREYLGELGLSLGGGESPEPMDFLLLLAQSDGRADAHIIQTMLLRSMNQAVYQPDNKGHFGLAYEAYAHFTSPIRRYPDLLVHRAIRSLLRGGAKKSLAAQLRPVKGARDLDKGGIYPYDMAAMLQLGEHCSSTERRADEATRDVVNWLKCEYLQSHVGEEFTGVVSAVTNFGLFVELKDLYVEGLVHVTSLPKDYYRFEQAHQRLVGERSRKVFHLGDEVAVQVVRVDLDERKVDFELREVKPARKKVSVSPRALQLAEEYEQKRRQQDGGKKAKKAVASDPWSGASGKLQNASESKSQPRKRKVQDQVPEKVREDVQKKAQEKPAEQKVSAAEGATPAELDEAMSQSRKAEQREKKWARPKKTPPRKGGKRPAVAARKAAMKADKAKATTKKAAKKTKSGKKKKPKK
ncbi:ribonuclease R [Biformimicrobium ophioploci]|uniref:Ribonuclease R n=1 Tax=Biformimicrobium ophioploci TaxID=3036711 RepID=A0ABQ6LUX6_9GAMM|nr:ribonuclease R [Microbulbifer sp. NKW57]GMG85860.1 ribonuclease R [Microbulbifer sp. NKW57]